MRLLTATLEVVMFIPCVAEHIKQVHKGMVAGNLTATPFADANNIISRSGRCAK